MMNRTLLLPSTLIVLTIACSGTLHAQQRKLVLIEEGVSRAPIVVFDGAPPYTRRAADDTLSMADQVLDLVEAKLGL
jgi:hypothetical protein